MVAPSWIQGNLKQMVRPAQTIDPPQHDDADGVCDSPLSGENDEPMGMPDEEISQLETLLTELEVKERELAGLALELYQALSSASIAGDEGTAQTRNGATDGSMTHPAQHAPTTSPQPRATGPAIIQAVEENGPRGVCESPSGSEGQEDSMPSPPRSPGVWQEGVVRRMALTAQVLQRAPGFPARADSRGRRNRNWRTLFQFVPLHDQRSPCAVVCSAARLCST